MAKRVSVSDIQTIRFLRERGYSLNEIKTKVNVGYGTIFRHIKGVEILPEYMKDWFGKRGGSKKRKRILEKEAAKKADDTIGDIDNKGRVLFLSALYWAEGNKKDFSFTNSDPEMISIFTNGLRNILKVPKEDLRVSLRVYEDMDKNMCLNYWSDIVGIPVSEFVNVNVLNGKKRGKLKYGMCRVRIRKGGNMLKYLVAVNRRVASLF